MDRYRMCLAKAACWAGRLRRGETGQGTTEYAILVGVLVVIAMLQELWDAIAEGINGL